MELFNNFKSLFLSVWERGILGVDIFEILIGLGIFFIFLVFRGIISKVIIKRLESIAKKTTNKLDDSFVSAMEGPARFLPIVLGVFFAAENVAHVAHFGGAAFGVVYYLSGYRLFAGGSSPRRRSSGLEAWFSGMKQRLKKKPPGVQLYEPPAENLDAEVDRILAKINEKGKSSLTAEEQATLGRASQEYRKRV